MLHFKEYNYSAIALKVLLYLFKKRCAFTIMATIL